MATCGIYKITHKESGKSYVGLSVNIENRWKQHRSFAKTGGRSAIYSALKKYGIDAFEFSIIEECDQASLEDREKHWIAFYGTSVDGYNLTEGGEVCKNFTSEARKNMSLAHLGKKQSAELIEKRISKIRGIKRTPEQNAAKSALMKGVGAGRKLTEEHKAKIGKPFLGRSHSEESKKMMSEAKKGKPLSEEHRKKLSASRVGKKFSEERKLRHSQALKAAWAKRKAEKENHDGK
jgi:group I intron endonuclease